MSACVVEEGREEGGGPCVDAGASDVTVERTRREVLMSGRGRRACSEQGPHPTMHLQHGTAHLWGANSGRRGWSRKRTSAPQMSNPHGSTPRVALVLRSRRSWPVAPQSYRSGDTVSNPHGSTPRVVLVLRSRRSWTVAPQSYRREDQRLGEILANYQCVVQYLPSSKIL
ncbi:uncharacterized protein LOC114353757 [Ostrinia furnacalis]|uniref:uncharacterized protein LOC114353757 n=1 Tax=Ostrinia furnacalis TaxID=93504 RepID=UPI001038D8F1|nr:uncharacterized protein LOC114353757 [Ostrinia furnacalis]